jgi:hypothetical protein
VCVCVCVCVCVRVCVCAMRGITYLFCCAEEVVPWMLTLHCGESRINSLLKHVRKHEMLLCKPGVMPEHNRFAALSAHKHLHVISVSGRRGRGGVVCTEAEGARGRE